MSGTGSTTRTVSHTSEDVTKVIRRFTADLKMMAGSSKGMTEEEAAKYGHDVEYLAQRGYLKMVDVTLLGAGVEVKAAQYEVKEGAMDLTPSKPGGVLWPEVSSPHLRIVLTHTSAYTQAAKDSVKASLKMSWSPTDANLNHPTLKQTGSRDYSSNSYGVSRKDFT